MADINKTIEIIFGAVDNTAGVIQSINSDVTKFGDGVQNVAGPVSDFTSDLLKTEAALVAMGIAMVAVSLNQAGEFQTSISEIGTLFNGTTDEVDQLSVSLRGYARNSASAIGEINEATYIAISTGTDWTDVNIALAASEQLAVAGATGLATATGALSRTMNAYGFEATEAQAVSEALFTTVQNGDTTMEALAANVGKVATTASGAGVSLEDMLSALAAVTIAGVSTAEATTSLKALFKELASPSDELTAALGGMSLETNTLQEIMNHLKAATGGSLTEMDLLFSSVEALQGAMILSNDASGAFENTLKAMEDRTGKLTAAYDKMLISFERVNQNLVNNIRVTLIEAGLPLLDEYGDAVNALSSVFAGIGDGIQAPNFDTVYGALEDFVNLFTNKINEIADALPEAMALIDFDDLIRAFGDLSDTVGDSFGAIFGDELDLAKPEDLAKALQKGVNIITTFVDVTGGIIEGFKPIFDALGEAAERTSETSTETANATGKFLGALTILGQFGTKVGTALIAINEAGVEMSLVFDIIEGTAKVVINSLQITFDTFALGIVTLVANVASALSKVTFGDVSDDFDSTAKELELTADAIASNLVKNAEEARDGWSLIGDGITGGTFDDTTKELEKVTTAVGDANAPIQDLTETFDDFADGVEKVPTAIPDATDALDDLKDSTENADDAQKGIVKTMIDGVPTYTGMADATKKLADEAVLSAEKAEELRLKYAELEVELESIASNERIKTMEFSVDLEIAKVEADAKKVVAAFESVADSYASSNKLISNLYTSYGDLGRTEQFHLEDSIDKAENLAREQWETQKDLIEAQIKQIEAATKRAESGDALITVDGGELQPELEAIMQSLFKSIRIKMSADYEDFLLGIQ